MKQLERRRRGRRSVRAAALAALATAMMAAVVTDIDTARAASADAQDTTGGRGGVVTLSPRLRFLPLETPHDPVDISAWSQALMNYRIIEGSPEAPQAYVVSGSEGRLISGAGDQVLARHVQGRPGQRFGLYTPGKQLKNEQGRVLGQVMIRQGVARLERQGTPLSTLTVEKSPHEVSQGAQLMALDDWAPPAQLTPEVAPAGIQGRIIDRPGAGRIVGLRDIVVIDLGRHQVTPGMRLRVQGEAQSVPDPVTNESLTLEGGILGELMVVRTLEQTSLALVTRAELPMATGDRLGAPFDD
ncbi:hypothetical protein SAMN05421848_2331 [Kushneria avicenniae]|uniref:Flagella basal body P-ring formation protein FlgA n=1 Tax=Kushneria avicenniae TaxID=402385 RepID=A0A1I1L252_9GAMM|nr:hypothetical protein [Kushneria avicenniae]SFC67109.1 hypothetical protein SAMN05421848_2331 [Kushneria avicenniae]